MAESRLVREDEDIMEGFDEFTGETGARIHMDESTRGGERERRKKEMAAQIAAAEAEEDSEEGGDESERERNEAFEAAQTRHGNYSTTADREAEDARPRTPPKISALPSLDGAISRLRAQLADMQMTRLQKVGEMAALEREKIRIGEEEVRIQKALKETGEKFDELRREKGIASVGAASGVVTKEGTPALLENGRGLGNGGLDEDAEEDVERPVLGLGMAGRGLESLGASMPGTPVQVSDDAMNE
jgi:hypothetical protein